MKIKIENVSKKFKDNEVLKSVNIVLDEGHIYGFSGRNGSGKTVLLKIICGIYLPTEGNVYYDNNLLNGDVYKYNVGALIENPKFFPDVSCYENLKILAEIKNEIGQKEIMAAIELTNLLSEKDKKFGKCSLGTKQKLGIAQAIMENQKIILLDEPFNGIEETSVRKIKDFLIKEKKKGKIIVISTHIKEDLNELADTIYHFDDGHVTETKG